MAASTPDSLRGAREGSPAGYPVTGFAGPAGEADSRPIGAEAVLAIGRSASSLSGSSTRMNRRFHSSRRVCTDEECRKAYRIE